MNQLTEGDAAKIKEAIHVIGKMVSSSSVLYALIYITESEPDYSDTGIFGKQPKLWSININTTFICDIVMGLHYRVEIKTTNSDIIAIIRSMIHSNDDDYDGEDLSLKTSWSSNWDYYHKITIKDI